MSTLLEVTTVVVLSSRSTVKLAEKPYCTVSVVIASSCPVRSLQMKEVLPVVEVV